MISKTRDACGLTAIILPTTPWLAITAMPATKSFVGARGENQSARDAAGVAADHVGGHGVGAERILEIEQFAEVLIFDFELGQPRLIGF